MAIAICFNIMIHMHTALYGDYNTTTMTVFFGTDDHRTMLPAEIVRTFTSQAEIQIHDDDILEGDEDIRIFLTSRINDVSRSNIELDVIIRDDEGVS